MISSKGFAAQTPKAPLTPFEFQRREVKPHDVQIDILYCGVCHSDIHQARDEWHKGIFPMVPGHEILGKVTHVGNAVTQFKVGDTVGVGCMVDSCRECESCKEHEEQFCENGMSGTYNGLEQDKKTPTYGGYSNNIVVDEKFTLKIKHTENLEAVAPLLCAGITTYSPLKRWNVGPGQKVAVVGLGGLGHMGVKLANAMGAKVTVFTTSLSKKDDALRLGAHDVVNSKDPTAMATQSGKYDFILDTVSAPHDLNQYLSFLKRGGKMVLVGVPDKPAEIAAFNLIGGRKTLAGSLIGGIKETQEMLDFCAEKKITSDIELIPMEKINEAYERMIKGDVKYRFVIDMKTL
ncbi:MAG: NAD(P)-dependent alcohol dehydrogenase [Bdellovibrionota bacterium]